MNFNFGEVLTRAWQIVWKHKVLWIFGFFAGCGRGGGNGGGGAQSGGGGTGPGTQPFPELERTFEQIAQWIQDNPWIIAVVVLIGLVLLIISIFLGTIGRIGLIRGTYQADTGAERLNFGELFSESMPYFWRVFGLSFLIFLIALLVFAPLVLFGALHARLCRRGIDRIQRNRQGLQVRSGTTEIGLERIEADEPIAWFGMGNE